MQVSGLTMRQLESEQATFPVLEELLRRMPSRGRPLQILEAGCGRQWYLNMEGIDYELTGIDLDPAALEARRTIKRDLHHSFVGDLRTADLPPQSYDVIYCAYVLEHVRGAEQVLKNFVRWLRPGGMIIVRVPDFDSVQGLITRLPPYWFHVFYYRYIEGQRNAGKPGFAPYPTVYDAVISRKGMQRFAREHGLELREELGHGSYKRGRPPFSLLIPVFAKTVSLLTFGRVHSRFSNLTFVLSKPAEEERRRTPGGGLTAA
jgi:SAM-dependent methyltransferase